MDSRTGVELVRLRGHSRLITSAQFSADGKRVVTASLDRTARVWNAEGGAGMAVLRGHEDNVWMAAFSPDGMRVVTGSADLTARLWDVAKAAPIAVLRGHTATVNTVVFSPDGSRVLTADHKTARLWNGRTGELVAAHRADEGLVGANIFSPDGARLLTYDNGDALRLWDARTGSEIALLTIPLGSDPIRMPEFSPDGRLIVAHLGDGTGRIWDGLTGTEIAQLDKRAGRVVSAGFSPRGDRLLVQSVGYATLRDIAWLAGFQGQDLRRRSCEHKLVGAQTFTADDAKDPILASYVNTNPCQRRGYLSLGYWLNLLR